MTTFTERYSLRALLGCWARLLGRTCEHPEHMRHATGVCKVCSTLVCECQLEGSPEGTFLNPMWCRVHGED